MIRSSFASPFASSRFLTASLLGLCCTLGASRGASRASAAPLGSSSLIASSDVWMPSQKVTGAKPAFMAFDSSRNALWTANAGSSTVSLRDANSGQLIRTVRVGKNPTSLALDEARKTLWVLSAQETTLFGLDTESLSVTAQIKVGKGAQLAAVDAKTGVVYTANCEANTVSIFDPAALTLSEVRVGGQPFGIAIDATRRRVYIANHGDASLSVLDADSHRSVGKIAVAAKPVTLAVDGESGALFVAHSEAGTVGIVPGAATGAATGETRIVETGGYPLGLSIDVARGRVYIADYDNQKLQILDTNGNALDDFDVAPAPTGLAFSARSGRVFVCSEVSSQLDVLDLKATTRPVTDLTLRLNSPRRPRVSLVSQDEPLEEPAETEAETEAATESEVTTETDAAIETEDANADDLPVAVEIKDNSVQRFSSASASIFTNGYANSSYGDSGGFNSAIEAPQLPSLRPSRRPDRVRRPAVRPHFQTSDQQSDYQFEEAPAGSLGLRIAQEAHKMQSAGESRGYHHKCDRLADTTIRRATRYFNNIVGPNPGDTAAKTMRRFQNAGIGIPFNASLKLRAGDILYSGSQVGGGCGHVMIVGLGGKICDQYGTRSRPTTRPNWVVRPDDAVRLAAR